MMGFGLVAESPSDRLAIRQDREVLYVEERGNYGVSHMKYGLVAQPMIQPADGRIAPAIARSISRWEGTKLVTAIEVDGYKLQQIRFLRPDGAMVVELRSLDRGSGSRIGWSAIYIRASR